VRGIGGLMTVRDDQGRAVPALDGLLDKDGRRVLRVEPSGWERGAVWGCWSYCGKLCMLAETLARHAEMISDRSLA
jgi:hypothetical protein